MLKRFEIIHNKEEVQEFVELTNWIWNSHSWVELAPGYCKCKWCGKMHSSEWGVNRDYPLCRENPAIKDLIINLKNGEIK